LPFSDESFDLVLCLYGLHHFRGYLEALREIARVLRSTGTFVLIDPVRNPNKPPGGHHGTDVPTREELDRMLGEAGFEIVLSPVSLGRMKAVGKRLGLLSEWGSWNNPNCSTDSRFAWASIAITHTASWIPPPSIWAP
jgi:SAM-dependent methyltransferase